MMDEGVKAALILACAFFTMLVVLVLIVRLPTIVAAFHGCPA